MHIKTLPFHSLSATEIHDYFKLRADVFVVEQNCVYPDIDGKDFEADHLLLFENEKLIACARIFKPNKEGFCSIGRVASDLQFRKMGYGHKLMNAAHAYILKQHKTACVEISAQCYLTKFYASHHYQTIGKQYLEDGIPHIKMQRTS